MGHTRRLLWLVLWGAMLVRRGALALVPSLGVSCARVRTSPFVRPDRPFASRGRLIKVLGLCCRGDGAIPTAIEKFLQVAAPGLAKETIAFYLDQKLLRCVPAPGVGGSGTTPLRVRDDLIFPGDIVEVLLPKLDPVSGGDVDAASQTDDTGEWVSISAGPRSGAAAALGEPIVFALYKGVGLTTDLSVRANPTGNSKQDAYLQQNPQRGGVRDIGSWLLELERTVRQECEEAAAGRASHNISWAEENKNLSCLTQQAASEILAGLSLRDRLERNALMARNHLDNEVLQPVLKPIGRLDKKTSGLLLVQMGRLGGDLSHSLCASDETPAVEAFCGVSKVYEAQCRTEITEANKETTEDALAEKIAVLKAGVLLTETRDDGTGERRDKSYTACFDGVEILERTTRITWFVASTREKILEKRSVKGYARRKQLRAEQRQGFREETEDLKDSSVVAHDLAQPSASVLHAVRKFAEGGSRDLPDAEIIEQLSLSNSQLECIKASHLRLNRQGLDRGDPTLSACLGSLRDGFLKHKSTLHLRLRVRISVGRWHVVRRLLAHVGLPVFELKRISVGHVSLEELALTKPGMSVLLEAGHVDLLFGAAFRSQLWSSLLRQRRVRALEARLQRLELGLESKEGKCEKEAQRLREWLRTERGGEA